MPGSRPRLVVNDKVGVVRQLAHTRPLRGLQVRLLRRRRLIARRARLARRRARLARRSARCRLPVELCTVQQGVSSWRRAVQHDALDVAPPTACAEQGPGPTARERVLPVEARRGALGCGASRRCAHALRAWQDKRPRSGRRASVPDSTGSARLLQPCLAGPLSGHMGSSSWTQPATRSGTFERRPTLPRPQDGAAGRAPSCGRSCRSTVWAGAGAVLQQPGRAPGAHPRCCTATARNPLSSQPLAARPRLR